MKIDTSLTMPQLSDVLSQAGLQFAVATEDDFDEIMAMSQDIYGGLDYLPTRYTSWLKETNRIVILARKQGKVVSPVNSIKIKNVTFLSSYSREFILAYIIKLKLAMGSDPWVLLSGRYPITTC